MTVRRVMVTGAAGRLGRALAEGLSARGFRLTLLDLLAYPGEPPAGCEAVQIDLADKPRLESLTQGHDAIVHLAGIAIEASFEEILHANIRCTWHVFEAARLARARVIFASSSHVVGFHKRDAALTPQSPYRPDTFYGLSKVYGEQLAQLYWHKHGVESLSLRIGSFLPEPVDRRHLATWLSRRDLVGLIEAALTRPKLGASICWGISGNADAWWADDGEASLSYRRQDDARAFAHRVVDEQLDPIGLLYQGAAFCAQNYTRVERPRPDTDGGPT